MWYLVVIAGLLVSKRLEAQKLMVFEPGGRLSCTALLQSLQQTLQHNATVCMAEGEALRGGRVSSCDFAGGPCYCHTNIHYFSAE